jgi:hypothetical protein
MEDAWTIQLTRDVFKKLAALTGNLPNLGNCILKLSVFPALLSRWQIGFSVSRRQGNRISTTPGNFQTAK